MYGNLSFLISRKPWQPQPLYIMLSFQPFTQRLAKWFNTIIMFFFSFPESFVFMGQQTVERDQILDTERRRLKFTSMTNSGKCSKDKYVFYFQLTARHLDRRFQTCDTVWCSDQKHQPTATTNTDVTLRRSKASTRCCHLLPNRPSDASTPRWPLRRKPKARRQTPPEFWRCLSAQRLQIKLIKTQQRRRLYRFPRPQRQGHQVTKRQ